MKSSMVLIALIWLFFSNCYHKDEASSELLGSDYFYVSSSQRGMIYKGDLEKTNTHILKISGNVEKYLFDDQFITALRHITPLEFHDSSSNDLFRQQHNGDTLQYWIINKANDSMYGPLDSVKYKVLINQLNLNPKIKL